MKKFLVTIAAASVLSACINISPNAFSVSPDQIARRQIETRKFSSIEEEVLLAAAANLLQDMGFNLDNTDTKLGLITASKDRDAVITMQIVAAYFRAALMGFDAAIDREQKIIVSLVMTPEQSRNGLTGTTSKSYFVRVTFQRKALRSDGSSFAETLKDEELYSGFFERLSKSVFIEGQKL